MVAMELQPLSLAKSTVDKELAGSSQPSDLPPTPGIEPGLQGTAALGYPSPDRWVNYLDQNDPRDEARTARPVVSLTWSQREQDKKKKG